MSKYTITIKEILENQWILDGHEVWGAKRQDIINNGLKTIFDFQYPIWDEEYRPTLEYRILSHYYLEEIGFETVGMFKMFLENKLNEEMPYYNELYSVAEQMGNPFEIEYRETDKFDSNNVHDRKNTGTQTNVLDGKNVRENRGTNWESGRNVSNGADYKNDDYASSATKEELDTDITDKTDDTNTRTDNLTQILTEKDDEKHTISGVKTVSDKLKVYEQLAEYYKPIDKQVIEMLSPLFMQIW